MGDEFAGRKARCPHCKTIYTVPAATGDQPTHGDGDSWLMRSTDGAEYGPVPKSELDRWFHEGRLDSAAQVRKENEASWRQSSELYPSLSPRIASSDNPFSSKPAFGLPEPNPYASPSTPGQLARNHRPHRGGLILTLSILGFACCQIFSVAAWVMGHGDLKEINAGRMDPQGRGLTQAGMIIGIVGTVLMILGIGAQIILVAIAIFSEM
ncbi:MAG: hypothetical protein H6822_23360 [Planctomycetaceae bacterium]|nr:hypothetical protein [Planctomycetales bacterium]MCB9925137.1 hypothetical protein [Planctomycetaceae bacterium]